MSASDKWVAPYSGEVASYAEHVARIVDAAPPLTQAQKDKLYIALSGHDGPRPGGLEDAERRAPKVTRIYRHYDKCGCLLYLGISGDPIRRAFGHSSTSWWAQWAVRMETDEAVYADRDAALAAERELIRTEGPVFNTQHAVDRQASVIRYLISHEMWDHLRLSKYVPNQERPELLRTLAEFGLFDGVAYVEDTDA